MGQHVRHRTWSVTNTSARAKKNLGDGNLNRWEWVGGVSHHVFPSKGFAPQVQVPVMTASQCHGASFNALWRGRFGACSNSNEVQVLLPLFSVEDKAGGTRRGHTFRGTHNVGAPSKCSFTGLHFQDDCIQPFLTNTSLLSYLQSG